MTEHDAKVLHLARYLRPVLPHLDAPPDLIAAVDHLLAQGPQAGPALERLLTRHPTTRTWMQEALWSSTGQRVEYSPLAGEVESPQATAYCCPEADCPTPPYISFQAGEPIPPCPVHRVALVVCAEQAADGGG